MAATDKLYRSQKTLDIVFAASCVLMLLSIFWMLYDDYSREFKSVQREFRDVETALAERQMLEKLPTNTDEIVSLAGEVKEARAKVEKDKAAVAKVVGQLMTDKAKLVLEQLDTKANLDSMSSLYNIDVEIYGTDSSQAKAKKAKVEDLTKKLDEVTRRVDAKQRDIDDKNKDVKTAEEDLAKLEDKLKKMTNDFDRLAKTTALKRWKWDDWVRGWPIIDGFASPTRIQQITLKELTIEYGSFSNVTRYDRCTTCHLGIERANFDKNSLRQLAEASDELKGNLKTVKEFLKDRQRQGEQLTFDPDNLPSDVRITKLTSGQVTQFCAHPRLELFVDANSKHPVEKFGCTICHAGQGSSTTFLKADHTPKDMPTQEEWSKKYGWEFDHDWEFPMFSSRFVESSCVKCHYNLTDLVTHGSKEEAPKLLRGYNLVKENGCFGCHEISGLKSGRLVGPDLRLEPIPPLEDLSPEERTKALSDADNPPGTQRKVGPSLMRLGEKTNEEWARKWLQGPRGFRPDTKMPHFYGLSTNSKDELPEDQRAFPDAEIHSVIHYLFATSNDYLDGEDIFRQMNLSKQKQLQDHEKELKGKAEPSADERRELEKTQRELADVNRRLVLFPAPTPLAKKLVDENGSAVELPPAPADDKARQAEIAQGRLLFTEKGCLACHAHQGTTQEIKTATGKLPGVTSEAHFGPDLSRLAAKIAPEKGSGDKDAKRRWLVQWILNPMVHHPRTRMPNVHLTVGQADQIAAWLLSQPVEADAEFEKWNNDPEAPTFETLTELARLYLSKAPRMTPHDVDEILDAAGEKTLKGFSEDLIKIFELTPDADEQMLRGPIDENKLKWYIGKKSIGRLGCYACHNIPGFETSKPTGTPLNDWGKKDPARLAFEDIFNYVTKHHNIVDRRDDKDDPTKPSEEWIKATGKNGLSPVEKIFSEALEHHHREGFLHQKLAEPRSYDYGRLRTWDDRLRMPQFKFAKLRRLADESDDVYAGRAEKEEDDAREAVMTFVLGLVAEPVPLNYVNNPTGDRLAVIKGRQVLEKYNCVGCHQVQPGYYEFKFDDEAWPWIEKSQKVAKAHLETDHVFPDHNAWMPPPGSVSADRTSVYGANLRKKEQKLSADDPDAPTVEIWQMLLARAARFRNSKGDALVLPAGEEVYLPTGQDNKNVLSQSDPFGGAFADLLFQYVIAKDPINNQSESIARAWLPPPLEHEGERVQPGWLFNFLKNPQPVRPTAKMMLRMPRFSLSDDEAMTLVQYFAAVDRLDNPGMGLTAPYVSIEQKDEKFWQTKTSEYVKRLGKEKLDKKAKAMEAVWAIQLKEEVDLGKERLKNAEASQKPDLEKQVKNLEDQLAKKDFADLRKQWEDHEVYAFDAYRILTDQKDKLCLQCHQVTKVFDKDAKGPSLMLSQERLRPDWTKHWLAVPRRMYTYDPYMPQPFGRGSNVLPELFEGDAMDKVNALRDILMDLPRVADMPANRIYRDLPQGGK